MPNREHPAIESLQRPGFMDLVKKGAEITGKTVGDAWDWATTPTQPAGEDAGFIENTLADLTSPAGIAEAIFPGVGMVKKPGKALWQGVDPRGLEKLSGKVESVARQLGPAEQELMQQTNIAVDPSLSSLGEFSTPDEAFEATAVKDLPFHFRQLNKHGQLPGTATINPNQSEEHIAEVLRHELRHANQFYNQGQNFAEGKSLLTPKTMYNISREAASFPNYSGNPAMFGEGFSFPDRYYLSPFEIDARSVQQRGADLPPDRIGALTEPYDGGGLPTEAIRYATQYHRDNPDVDDAIVDLLMLTDDTNRTSRTTPGYLGRINENDSREMDILGKHVMDARSRQKADTRNAIQALLNSLGLK